jgi:hypothetical protein
MIKESLLSLHRDRRSEDVYFDIARGCYRNATTVHVFGSNPDVDMGSAPETVWDVGGGLYPWSSWDTASALTCVSTDAGDTGVLTIYGLDADLLLLTEEVTLNGLTPVVTTNVFGRINLLTYAKGSDTNIGAITTTISAVTVGHIQVGASHSIAAIYTIPAGHTGYFLQGQASVQKTKNAQILTLSRFFGGPFMIAHVGEVSDSSYIYRSYAPIALPEKTDLEQRAGIAETNGTRVTASFDLVLIKN